MNIGNSNVKEAPMNVLYIGDCESAGNGMALGLEKYGIKTEVISLAAAIPVGGFNAAIIDSNTLPENRDKCLEVLQWFVPRPTIVLTTEAAGEKNNHIPWRSYIRKPFTIEELVSHIEECAVFSPL